jgi:hypothetical protein
MANDDQNPWKWAQTALNAASFVNQFFNTDVQSVANIKDKELSALIKSADASDVQVKRVQDGTRALNRKWNNQARIGAMLHGLVRRGLGHVLTQRTQDSQTAKQYAKLLTKSSELSHKTTTTIEKMYHGTAKVIEGSTQDLELAKAEIDDKHETTRQIAGTRSTERRTSYRERAQLRLAKSKRPWRN